MHLNTGAVIIILILGACAAAAIYFTVKGYLITRRDPFSEPDDAKPAKTPKSTPKSKEKNDQDAPPPPS